MDDVYVRTVLEAGKALTTAADRGFNAEVTVRGIKTVTPYVVDATGAPRVLKEALDLAVAEANRVNPERSGSYQFTDLNSLIDWANRYKTDNTVAFVSVPDEHDEVGSIDITIDELPANDGSRTAAADSVPTGASRKLKATLEYDLSPELQCWVDWADKLHTAEAFHAFIDEHSDELTSAEVLSMITNIEVSSETKWVRVVEANGTVRLADESKAGPKTAVPKKFAFTAPLFSIDDPADLAKFECTLRLKMDGKKPVFQYQIVGLNRTIQQASLKLVTQLRKHFLAYLGSREG